MMRKRRISFRSALLALCMLFALIPASASAAAPTSGTCGPNLTWTLNGGTLTISGTGPMTNYINTNDGFPPWYGDSRITTVVINKGVTTIGDFAFISCENLSSVTIPEGVTSIGEHAFSGARALDEISFHSTLTHVGWEPLSVTGYSSNGNNYQDGILYVGSVLIDVDFYSGGDTYAVKSGTTVIADRGLEFLRATALSIPSSVRYIGENLLGESSSVEKITVSSSNPNYASRNGVLFNKGLTQLITYPTAKAGAYAVPSGVTTISNYAFNYCQDLTGITFPNSLTTVGESAFCKCRGLTSLTIPGSVTAIGDWAFAGCINLTSIQLQEGLKSIGKSAFSNCYQVPALNIPASVTSIGQMAFAGCEAMSFTVSDGNTSYCVSDGVLFNRDMTQLVCCPLSKTGSYTVPAGVTSIGGGAFYNSPLTEVKLPEGLRSIGDEAFERSALVSLQLPSTVATIGESAFCSCVGLTEMVFPDSVYALGHNVFMDCENLTRVTLSSNLRSIPSGLFAFTGLTELEIPESVTSIGEAAFSGCKGLTSVTIPGLVETIDEKAFVNCTGFTIYGYTGSRAESFAQENQIDFVALESDCPFVDIRSDAYYRSAVLWGVENNVVAGMDAYHFGPEGSCTRAQVVAFLWRAMGKPESTVTDCPFVDIDPNEYYYDAMLWAYEQGIVAGVDSTHFAPNDTVTRAQFVAFLWRTEGRPDSSASTPFVDLEAGEYYVPAVQWAYERGVVAGIDETHFGPKETCKRCQVLAFLYRDMG